MTYNVLMGTLNPTQSLTVIASVATVKLEFLYFTHCCQFCLCNDIVGDVLGPATVAIIHSRSSFFSRQFIHTTLLFVRTCVPLGSIIWHRRSGDAFDAFALNGWRQERASGLQKNVCWYVGALIGAERVLAVTVGTLLQHIPGWCDILVPAVPGCRGNWPLL